jgi:hypothetical protein
MYSGPRPPLTTTSSSLSLFIFYLNVIFRSCKIQLCIAKSVCSDKFGASVGGAFRVCARCKFRASGGGIFSAAHCIRSDRAANDFSSAKLSPIVTPIALPNGYRDTCRGLQTWFGSEAGQQTCLAPRSLGGHLNVSDRSRDRCSVGYRQAGATRQRPNTFSPIMSPLLSLRPLPPPLNRHRNHRYPFSMLIV